MVAISPAFTSDPDKQYLLSLWVRLSPAPDTPAEPLPVECALSRLYGGEGGQDDSYTLAAGGEDDPETGPVLRSDMWVRVQREFDGGSGTAGTADQIVLLWGCSVQSKVYVDDVQFVEVVQP